MALRHQINQRMADRPARINAYDRRLAAIHEAGHALMAVYLGYNANTWIHANETSETLSEKTWLGHMALSGHRPEHGHPHMRRIAVAGLVAEVLWKNGHDEEYAEPYGWEDYLWDEDCMSFSDWRNADCEPGNPDDDLYNVLAEVASIFMGVNWPVLTDMSRTLMSAPDRVHQFSPLAPISAQDAA